MEAIAHVIRLEHKDGWSLESLDWNHLKHGDTSSCDRIGGTNQSQQGELKKLEEPHQETSCECDSGPIQDPTAVSRFRIRHVETSEGRAKLTFRRTPSIDLARVVHDLRTPLAAIVSAAERLQTEALAPAVVRTEAVTIGRAGRGLLAEVESLLALDRGQAGTPASTALAGAWDPRAVAAEVVELLAPTARSKGLILRLADVGSAGLRRGDAVPFRRIVMNLVGNAVKFSDRGSIVVTLGSRQGTLVVSVRDEGPGIEPDAIPNLFEPGFRGTRASGIAGHGLGLANVRDLVTGMGGSIRVESRPGDGATFIVELPETVPAPRLDGVRALLVEDCDDNRRLLHHHLRSAGAEVLLAPDGLAAESVARAARIDIVLLDLAMPGRGGIETLRVLRSFGVHAPAVALTASTDAETLERTRNAGFVRVLTKPVDPSTLRRELRAALAVRAAA